MADRALVTGGTGFVGRHLVRALDELGAEVRCLVRPTSNRSNLEPYNVSYIQGDVLHRESFEGHLGEVDVVYHLAGATVAFKRETYFQVNEKGTRNLVQACAACQRPPTVVLVSTLVAVGPARIDRPLTEDVQPAPVSVYGESKLAGERVVREWAAAVPATIVRPPIVFGEYDRDVFRMYQLAARGWHLVPSLRKKQFSFIYAGDLAKGLILAAQNGERLEGEREAVGVYHISDPAMPTYADLGPLLAQGLDRERVRVVRVPEFLTWAIAAYFEIAARIQGTPSILNFDKARENSAGSWTCSPEKAARQLGFRPAKSLRERFRETGQWYLEHGWL